MGQLNPHQANKSQDKVNLNWIRKLDQSRFGFARLLNTLEEIILAYRDILIKIVTGNIHFIRNT